jgi:glyoxylase-like metal-dependent hydrolase (beta-lactamase superfamily II)
MSHWEDIYEVPLPLPFALKVIKAYVIRGKNGITIVDTGLHTKEDIEVWHQVQQEIGFAWQDVNQIVLTHYHPDHYGLAGTIQQWTNAPVHISKKDFDQAQLFFSRTSDMPEVMAQFFSKHGLSREWVEQIPGHMRGFYEWVEPHPKPTFIQAGEMIRLGDRDYEILHTPGHADGHLSFYDPERQWLIGGDFLLPKITPNISLWPKGDPNPLARYLETLDRMKELPVKRVFPSHGPVFDHYQERIEELKRHHQKRLEIMLDQVIERDGATVAEVCLATFGGKLSIHNLRFAISETLAHLEYLRLNGELMIEEKAGVKRYLLKNKT